MAMVSEQVEELRENAEEYRNLPFGDYPHSTARILAQAADTIEALSAKLEKALAYYGGWIVCEDRLPEIMKPVLVCDRQGNVCVRAITCEIKGKKYWSQDKCDIVAWQPLPEPYKQQ